MGTTGTQRIYQSLVILTIITLGLYFAGTLIMPIIFSGFVAVLLNPVADFMERLKFPRGLASLIAVLLGSVFIVGLFIIVLIQSQEIIAEVPQLIQNNSSFLVLSADQFEIQFFTNIYKNILEL